MFIRKGNRLKQTGKYVLGYIFSLLLLVTAAGIGNAAAPGEASSSEADMRGAAPGGDYRVVQPYGENVYKPTPSGDRSEAWGDDRYGPDHLRRISPTEHLPASPQVERVIPLK